MLLESNEKVFVVPTFVIESRPYVSSSILSKYSMTIAKLYPNNSKVNVKFDIPVMVAIEVDGGAGTIVKNIFILFSYWYFSREINEIV